MKRALVWTAVLGMLISMPAGAGEKKAEKKQFKIIKKIGKKGSCCPQGGPMKKRGFLGVHLIRLTKELRAHFGAPQNAGVMVAKVEKDSPADKAGVKVGDVLTEVDGESVDSAWGVQRLIGKKKEGQKASLKVVRSKRSKKLTASIVERKRPQVEVSRFLQWGSEGEGEAEVEVLFDTDFLDETMHGVREHLHDLDIGKKVFKFHKIEGDIEERLEKMEEKLRKFEKKLQGRLFKKSRHTTL